MHIYKLKSYRQNSSKDNFLNLFKVARRTFKSMEFLISINEGKISFDIFTPSDKFTANEFIFPFYLSKEDQFEFIRDFKLGFLRYNRNLETLYYNSYFNKNRVIQIRIKPITKISSVNLLIACVYFEKGNRSLIFIPSMFNFLSLKPEGKLQFESAGVQLKSPKNFPESTEPILISDENAIGIDNFDFNKHSLIIGQSGVGKSKLIELLSLQLIKNKSCKVIIIDPHANIFEDKKIKDMERFDFKEKSLDLYSNIGDPLTSTELSIDLFSSLLPLNDNYYLYRILKFSLLLLYSLKIMSLSNLQKLITDLLFRKSIIKQTENVIIKDFFESEFMEISTKHYAQSILPILNLISEFLLIDSQDGTSILSIEECLKTFNVVHICPSVSQLGTKITKLIAGAMIQQIFIFAQSRKVDPPKIILFIDELSIIENPAITKILSEARKFNLSTILALQYLDQVSQTLRNGMKSNIVNYFCFKMSREDAVEFSNSLNIEFEKKSLDKKSLDHIKDQSIKLFTSLNPREVIVRVMSKDRFMPAIKMKTINI